MSVDSPERRLVIAIVTVVGVTCLLGVQVLPVVVLAGVGTALIAAVPFAAIGTKRDEGRPRWWSALLAGGVVGSGMAYVLATSSPLSMRGEVPRSVEGALILNLNLVPVIDMLYTPLRLLVINLALLAPRVLPAAAAAECRDPRGTLFSLVPAVGVEAAQLIRPMRGSNIDDVLLNVFGV